MLTSAILTALLLFPIDTPAPALTLPAEVKIAPGKLGTIQAQTTGPRVKWVLLTPGLDIKPLDDGKTLIVAGLAGRYELLAYTALGDVPSEPARCVVVIGIPEPLPPPPPKDALKEKLAAAFAAAAGTAAQKAEWAKDLAALYRAAAKLASDDMIGTAGQLKSKLADASKALIGAEALREVRVAVAGELAAILPSTDTTLTDSQRQSAAKLFERLAAVMDEIAQ